MSNAINIGTVNLSQNSSTPANQFFNNYYTVPSTISTDQNDAVVAYFQQVTGGNLQSAAILASTVIYTAMAQGMDPMAVIQQFQSLPQGQLNSYLSMFLNLNRVGTSVVGFNNQQNTNQNKYILRSILA
jgi:hypothetical protein